MTLIERFQYLYRRRWRGYSGSVIPLRCRIGLHQWSPNLLVSKRCRICRLCVKRDEGEL